MSEDEEGVEELYLEALERIESSIQEREQKFPKIEALRYYYKDLLEDVEGKKGKTFIQVVIDDYTRRIEEILDPEKDDPIDPDEWLEFGYDEREPRITREGEEN